MTGKELEMMLGGLIMMVATAAIFAYFPLQFKCLKWQGTWRVMAIIPLVLMIPVFVVTVIGLVEKSNLWPLFLIFAAPIATGYLLVLKLIYYFLIKDNAN